MDGNNMNSSKLVQNLITKQTEQIIILILCILRNQRL